VPSNHTSACAGVYLSSRSVSAPITTSAPTTIVHEATMVDAMADQPLRRHG
jgi:hypothetical protein